MRPRFFTALLILLLMTSIASAQEATPEITEEPVVVEVAPEPEITEEATAAPTEEPTAAPTEAPPEATEEQGSETPESTDEPEQTTEPDIPTPDVVSAPPVFEIASSLSVEAGQPLSIPFVVYDEQGAVVLSQIVSAAGAQTTLEIAAPIQTSSPFATTGTITYTAAETLSGAADTLTLTAVDGAGTSATTIVEIAVLPAVEVTEEATAEATAEATQEATEEAALTVERIISYNPAAPEESIQAMLATIQATEISRIPQLGAMKVLVPNEFADPELAIAALHGSQAAVMAGVTTIEENGVYQLDFVPNDPAYSAGSSQWPLRPIYAGSMWTEVAWDMAKQDGLGVLVAVLDTGVDLQHPDLIGQIDVARGWDFINDDNNPDDDHVPPPPNVGGHGTHIAGIIAAKTNNSLFMAGIAYRAKIIPVKVCTASTGCPTYEIAAGIVHAVDRGAHIINLSLGGPFQSTTVQGAVQYALSRNVTVIASAGNSGTNVLQYPASYPGVISVAAHDINANIASFSTFNNSVTISAPGVNLFSLARMDWPGGTGSNFWSGTSAAAANVSGVAALVYADNIARTPALIREVLICSAIDLGAAGYDQFYGYGIVQADWAMNFRVNSANCKLTQPNDLIGKATEIKKVPFTVTQPVHSRSVTGDASDPNDCFTPIQTLWYKFIPPVDQRYQITTYGSSYNTVIAVYQGAPGRFTRLGCEGGGWLDPGAHVSLDMKKGQPYYIGVYTIGAAVNDQIMQLDIRPAIAGATTQVQENAPNFAYSGGWQPLAVKGASGGKVMQTYNDRGIATFTFRGRTFEIFRLVGPDQGSMEVWINSTQFDFNGGLSGIQNLDNRAALQAIQRLVIPVPNSSNGQWNTVSIRRAAGGFAGPIAIDMIATSDLILKQVTIKSDDREATKLRYSLGTGDWTPMVSTGAFKNTITQTSTQNATVQARVKGSTIIIYRNIGPGFGSMNVFINDVLWGTVDNSAGTLTPSVPFAITNLAPIEHVIRLRNNSGSTLAFDAIEGRLTGAFAPNLRYNVAHPNVLLSGVWSIVNNVNSPYKKTLVTSSPTARLDFNFTGDGFCIAFDRRVDGGTMLVYVDNMNTIHEQVSTNDSPSFWGTGYFWPPDMFARQLNPYLPEAIQQYCTGAAFPYGVHHVRLLFPSGFPVELSSINPGRVGLLTPANGLVPETDTRIFYTDWAYYTDNKVQTYLKAIKALWRTFSLRSLGGALAQGGSLKRFTFPATPLPPTPNRTFFPALRFYISGTGFILYTSSGPLAGDLNILVCPPMALSCASPNIIIDGVNVGTFVDLTTPGSRARPFAYAVTGLPPGVHEIVIYVNGANGQYIDFDGVRVLP